MKKRTNDIVSTVKEVSEILNIPTWRVYQLVREGKLPAIRIGHMYRICNHVLNNKEVPALEEYKDILTAKEIANILKISKDIVYQLFYNQDIPNQKVGHIYQINKGDIINYLKETNYNFTIVEFAYLGKQRERNYICYCNKCGHRDVFDTQEMRKHFLECKDL